VSADNGAEPEVDFSDTDEQKLLVSTRSMRNALWYWEHYYIQKDVVSSQALIIEGQAVLIDEWEVAFQDELALRVRAERRSQNWSIFGFTAGTFGVLMLVLEFIRELQENPI